MRADRRQFLAAGAASAIFAVPSDSSAGEAPEGAPCLDYGRSFITNKAPFNSVRFWVESRTTLWEAGGASHVFYQCGSCKSENTFAPDNLFMADNYDFLPILGKEHWLIFRRPARLSPDYRRVQSFDQVWGEPELKLQSPRSTRKLVNWEQIRDATADGLPLVGQTEIQHSESGLRAVLEYPIKTMNVSLDRKLYQVDTGPVGFPDLSRLYEVPVDCLRLAFVAFNAPGFADFILEQPTPLVENEKVVGQIYHYSNPFSLPARNTLLALEP